MAGGVGGRRLAIVRSVRPQENQTEPTAAVSNRPGPRRFTRVPTHAIGVAGDRRSSPRASLSLPLRLLRIGGVAEPIPITLVTRDISASGVYFLAPRDMEPGTAVELEVVLVERPLGLGNVQMSTSAHIVRSERTDMPGWRGYGARFDDFSLERDDGIPKDPSRHYTL